MHASARSARRGRATSVSTSGILPLWREVAEVPPAVLAAVAAMLVAQPLVARLGLWPYALFALPGTAAHELAHWLAAHLLRAAPRMPSLVPRRTATGWRLGAVAFSAPWWRAGPVALAPLLLLPAALAWLVLLAAPAQGAWIGVHAWIVATLLRAARPSRADLRIAAPFLGGVALAGVAALLAWSMAPRPG